MTRYDLIVIGAGPSGLSAAIVAARRGMDVIVFDENARPGGQLFKQVHKFFGSKEHHAKERGIVIGEELLAEASAVGVKVELNSTVIGLYGDKEVMVRRGDEVFHVRGDAVLISTGAAENTLPFPGWTLPGVIGAGAAQTMMNLYGVKPGNRVLMVGSGNVGLVVSFQLIQAGCQVVALVDAAPRIGGYGVHASEVARTGVPFLLSHTVVRAEGESCVTGAVVAEVDSQWKVVPGTEKHLNVDTICLAVGLSPMSQLAQMAGCSMIDEPKRGGLVPRADEEGATSVPGIYVSGDCAGIEEASSAMIEGRIAGESIARYLGYESPSAAKSNIQDLESSLSELRQGMFAPENRGKTIDRTEEGCPVSASLLTRGYLDEDEISAYPGIIAKRGPHAVIECTQNIPCNPCRDSCPKGCIAIQPRITALPRVLPDKECIACGMCVASCPGQAIFIVDENAGDDYATVTLPYELSPLPERGVRGYGLARDGKAICEAQVESVRSSKAFDHTALLTMRVPKDCAMRARFFSIDMSGTDVTPLAAEAIILEGEHS